MSWHSYRVSLAITQCYLPLDTSEHTPPSTPACQAGARFTYSGRMMAELTYVTCYIPRWFRQRSAISGRPLPNKQTLDPQSAARQTHMHFIQKKDKTHTIVHVQFHIQFGAWKSIDSPSCPKICQVSKKIKGENGMNDLRLYHFPPTFLSFQLKSTNIFNFPAESCCIPATVPALQLDLLQIFCGKTGCGIMNVERYLIL